MRFEQTAIEGVWLVTPERHGDARGYFAETYREDLLREATGFEGRFVQDNESLSRRGVIRGLHLQAGSSAQAKLVRVTRGAIFDVAVDLRPGSPTFGDHVHAVLDHQGGRQILIPRGFAHGFAVLSEEAQFQYKVDNFYDPASEVTLDVADPDLAIPWPFDPSAALRSDRDRAHAISLRQYADRFVSKVQ